MCKENIFKKLLFKLTTECIFTVNDTLFKQTDGVSMGGPLSVVLSGCFMTKMEMDLVVPSSSKFYKRYVDDIKVRRKKVISDQLFESINKYHPILKLTIETNPSKFLDTGIIQEENGTLLFKVHDNENKIPFHWSSAVPKRYKRNIILGELHRAKRISSNFLSEVVRIKNKYMAAGYPVKYIESVIRSFSEEKDDPIIPNWLFNNKREVYIRIPYCKTNELYIYKMLRKLEHFSDYEITFKVIWITRNIRSLFPIKDKTNHISNVIYKGECSCGSIYIGETVRNANIRWEEHEAIDGKSEPAKHLVNNNNNNHNLIGLL